LVRVSRLVNASRTNCCRSKYTWWSFDVLRQRLRPPQS
jgi:hypothetical protein